MGKKRIKMFGAEEALKKSKGKKTKASDERGRKIVKTGKEHGRVTDMGAEALAEAKRLKEKEKKLAKETQAKTKKTTKKKSRTKTKSRSNKYLAARKKIDRNKFYLLSKAIKLVQETSISKFNGSVEVHFVVKEKGITGEVKFPHSTGKKTKIEIANDETLKKIEKGKIDFDVLLATPKIMPKLAKYAKTLGPRGLMPNPKRGTITDKPEELAKQMIGKTRFKTESKAPLIHMVIGKVDSKVKELEANFKTLVDAVGLKNIEKAVLTSTMGPGLKVDLTSLSKTA